MVPMEKRRNKIVFKGLFSKAFIILIVSELMPLVKRVSKHRRGKEKNRQREDKSYIERPGKRRNSQLETRQAEKPTKREQFLFREAR